MIPLPTLQTSIDPIATALDAATHDARVNWARGLGSGQLHALWDLTAGRTVTIDQLCGAEGEVIIHEGKNSLPFFCDFQKRVMRRGDVVQGYNHQSMSWLTGPGHFTVTEENGEALFDYTRDPVSAPDTFPPLVPNEAGLSRLVYAHMKDYLRRVSTHAVIGAAFKKGKAVGPGDRFLLVRS